jgi:hypothetical protein
MSFTSTSAPSSASATSTRDVATSSTPEKPITESSPLSSASGS